MITVYGYPHSRSDRIVWLLEELEQAYEFKLIDFTKAELKSPAVLKINPAGKVPALQEGDLVMTESGAMVTYIADKFSEAGLIPKAGTTERAIHDQWSYFALTELEQPLWTQGKHKFALPKEYRVNEIFPTTVWEFSKALALFSAGLGDNEFILGSKFQVADILLAHTLDWAMAFKNDLEYDNLKDYATRLTARPAFARAIEKHAS